MPEPYSPPTGWRAKFANALRGVQVGVRSENSFRVHLPAALLVVGLAFWLRLDTDQLALLVVCIFTVCGAELFNASLERLARAVDQHENPQLRDALDLASGAVLVTSVGAAMAGVLIFAAPVWNLIQTL